MSNPFYQRYGYVDTDINKPVSLVTDGPKDQPGGPQPIVGLRPVGTLALVVLMSAVYFVI
jgi:hypothetical protein